MTTVPRWAFASRRGFRRLIRRAFGKIEAERRRNSARLECHDKDQVERLPLTGRPVEIVAPRRATVTEAPPGAESPAGEHHG